MGRIRKATMFICAFAVFIAALGLQMPVDASSGSKGYSQYIQSYSIGGRQGQMETAGTRPYAIGMKNTSLQKQLNDRFINQFNIFVSSADDNVEKIDFSYEFKEYGQYLSVIFKCVQSGAADVELVSTTVVDTTAEEIVFLEGVTIGNGTNVNGVKIANNYINSLIKSNSSEYNPNFSGITKTQSFYIENGKIVFVFDAYVLKPGASSQTVQMSLSDIKNFTISEADYYTQPPEKYSVRMIQLRQVLEQFGYTLGWNNTSRRIDIKKGSTIAATLRVEVNSYTAGKEAARELECAPEIYTDSRTYVPISFFEEILGISYAIDSSSNEITFSVYSGK